jgi:hypothetical protein
MILRFEIYFVKSRLKSVKECNNIVLSSVFLLNTKMKSSSFSLFCNMIFLGVILFTASSCSSRLTPFTDTMLQSGSWKVDDMKKVQFYISSDIVLRRQLENSSARIESGKIKIIDGRRYEEIVIRRGTPGVYVFSPDNERLAISFEKDKYLMFGPRVDRNSNGEFVLLASKWEKNRGIVKYGDKFYDTPANSAFAILEVDARRTGTSRKEVKVVQGRRIR